MSNGHTATTFSRDYYKHIRQMMNDHGLDDEHREHVIQEFWYPLTPDQATVKFREAYEAGVSFSDFLTAFKVLPPQPASP